MSPNYEPISDQTITLNQIRMNQEEEEAILIKMHMILYQPKSLGTNYLTHTLMTKNNSTKSINLGHYLYGTQRITSLQPKTIKGPKTQSFWSNKPKTHKQPIQ